MPVLKSLDCWPALPVIVKYGGAPNLDPPALEDDENIIAALKQSGRVSSISLTVTSSLLEKLSSISEPLSELEELVLLSQDNVKQIFPSTFRWGPRLRALHLTRIAFPSLLPLLLPCQDLVDLQLHEIPNSGYFSPEEFANALSGTPQLRSLTLHILSFPRRRSYLGLPLPSGERAALAALTHLKYRGTSKYLDSFVGRINAPRLKDIEITLFSQPTMDAVQLGQFIQRTQIHTPLTASGSYAIVEISSHAISISFTERPGHFFSYSNRLSTPLRLQISCKQLDWQLSCMAQICDQISPSLFHVNRLRIETAQLPDAWPDEQVDADDEQWVDLLRSFKFGAGETFWVDGKLAADIMCALGPANEGNTAMLPSLRQFHIQNFIEMDGPSWNSVQSFITSRSISGRPVKVEAPSYQCHICHRSSAEQLVLKRHLRDVHGYQILCSYCGEFNYISGRRELFREHIEAKHPEIAHNDGLISNRSLTLNQLQFGDLINRHSFLRPPDLVQLGDFNNRMFFSLQNPQ